MGIRYATYKELFKPHRYALTTHACPKCGKTEVIEVPAEGLFKINQGAFIQDAFPDLTPAQRERLITAYCEPCFDALFPDEDEER